LHSLKKNFQNPIKPFITFIIIPTRKQKNNYNMKTTKITLASAVLLVAASLLLTDCKKKTKETTPAEPDNEQGSAADNAMAENTSNDALSMGSQLSENSGTLTTYRLIGNNNNQNVQFTGEEFGLAAVCATITAGTNTLGLGIPASYTIDFGTAGCQGLDGKTRKGKLMYDFSQSAPNANRYRKPGFKMIVTSSGYSVDNNTVTISKTVTNTSPIAIATETAYSGTNLTWSIASNLTINKSGGGTITWNCNRNLELANSSSTLCYHGQQQPITWTQAQIKLNGTASGTNAGNESYTAVATNLLRDFTCSPDPNHLHHHPFVSGTIDYTPGQRATRHIDYGSGGCDLNATVTINGQTFTMTLP
jgi:hypothetical protein